FERLKDIKQLGLCYWVFPGASHNRFEHCLGTAHLCGKLIDTLCNLHRGEIEITKKESLCIKIAGLCHDLGHGPFSHFFDGVYIPRAIPGSQWKHEKASCDMFDHMIASNPSLAESFEEEYLGREEIDFIKELILGWCTCL
ncbi:deoxynucleoside triphosphate triphosphohydrolase SAMHD1, partial [Paramuricea clavata]